VCYFSSHTLLLGLPFFSYTKLDLICRNKYCCSKSINLGTIFARHSGIKSSKGELLHRSVRLERKLIYQVNWKLGSQKGGGHNITQHEKVAQNNIKTPKWKIGNQNGLRNVFKPKWTIPSTVVLPKVITLSAPTLV
jgi:hypothetical protein